MALMLKGQLLVFCSVLRFAQAQLAFMACFEHALLEDLQARGYRPS